jgi:hypothetical protein
LSRLPVFAVTQFRLGQISYGRPSKGIVTQVCQTTQGRISP